MNDLRSNLILNVLLETMSTKLVSKHKTVHTSVNEKFKTKFPKLTNSETTIEPTSTCNLKRRTLLFAKAKIRPTRYVTKIKMPSTEIILPVPRHFYLYSKLNHCTLVRTEGMVAPSFML